MAPSLPPEVALDLSTQPALHSIGRLNSPADVTGCPLLPPPATAGSIPVAHSAYFHLLRSRSEDMVQDAEPLSCAGVACSARYGRYGKFKQTLIGASRGKGNFCDMGAFPAHLRGTDEEE